MKSYVHRNPRPLLTVEFTGSTKLGRCYHESRFRVTSDRRLTREDLRVLYVMGILGSGQEFGVESQCDGLEEPAFHDEVPCTVLDSAGNVLDEPAINPYSGEPYPPFQDPHYVYDTFCRCDSGD